MIASQVQRSALTKGARHRAAPTPHGTQRKAAVSRAHAAHDVSSVEQSRRTAMLNLVSLSAGVSFASALTSAPVSAEEAAVEYTTFYGLASPPTSYGGYGGNANESPKYKFEHPTGWKSEQPNKVEKGTQGIDCRVVSPRSKDQKVFVITLTRAGEDDKSFKLTDLDSTFAGFAGADYQLLDAVSNANSIEKDKREVDGMTFYIYDIDSPEFRYLSSIAVKDGKVFAMFVKSPTKLFRANEAKLRHIIDTFRLL